MRNQPVAAFDHLLRRQRKARFVGRPRVAQADAGADDHERHQQEPAKLAPRQRRRSAGRWRQVGTRHGGSEQPETKDDQRDSRAAQFKEIRLSVAGCRLSEKTAAPLVLRRQPRTANQRYRDAASGSAARVLSASYGRRTVNTAPPPGRLSARMLPP